MRLVPWIAITVACGGTPAPTTPTDLDAWRVLNRLPADLLGLALPRLGWH